MLIVIIYIYSKLPYYLSYYYYYYYLISIFDQTLSVITKREKDNEKLTFDRD